MHKKFLRTSLFLSAMLLCTSFSANAGVVNSELEKETETTTISPKLCAKGVCICNYNPYEKQGACSGACNNAGAACNDMSQCY